MGKLKAWYMRKLPVLQEYRKGLIAVAGAVVTIASTLTSLPHNVLPEGSEDIITGVVAAATAIGVILARNKLPGETDNAAPSGPDVSDAPTVPDVTDDGAPPVEVAT